MSRAALALLACARGGSALYFYVTEGAERCFIEEVPAETLIVGTYASPDVVPWGGAGFSGVGLTLAVHDPARNAVLTKALEPAGRFALTSAVGGEYTLCFATNTSRWQAGGSKKYRLDLQVRPRAAARFAPSRGPPPFAVWRARSSSAPRAPRALARRPPPPFAAAARAAAPPPRPLPPPPTPRLSPQLDVGETGIDYAEVAKREHLSELEVEMRRLNDKLKDLGKEQLYQRERELAFRATSESTAGRVKWWSIFQTAVMLGAGLWQIYHLRTFLKSKKIN